MRNTIQNQPEQIIQNKLSAIQRRMRIDSVIQNLATFNFWGLLIVGALLVANRFFPLPIPIGYAASLPIVAASVIAVSLSLIREIDPFAVAHLVDQCLNLKERLGTALEAIHRGGVNDFAICRSVMLRRRSRGWFPLPRSPTQFQRLSNGFPSRYC